MSRTTPDTLSDILNPADLLLHSKALEPLGSEAVAVLKEIEDFSRLEEFTEMDVREEIVTPILRVLGYRKESMFSMTREKHMRILEKGLSADYSGTLWQEDFWVLEAKKPSVTNGRFGYGQLWQAVQYAIHPEINAALVVLCDGYVLEIFDREASLAAPILRVERGDLIRDFDKIRALLDPIQAWFFQKRRVVRLIDKVFDREFHIGRIEDFRKLIDRRLVTKRQKAVENRRRVDAERNDPDAEMKAIEREDVDGIIDGYFYHVLSKPVTEATAKALVSLSFASPFRAMHKLFPDDPAVMNDNFVNHGLFYMIRLGEVTREIPWLPAWLQLKGGALSTDDAIKKLIELSLTHFAGDEVRKIVLLYANGIRRVIKASIMLEPEVRREAEMRHALERFTVDEFSMSQAYASPERHLMMALDALEHLAVHKFVTEFQQETGKFLLESARLELTRLWKLECKLLSSVPDYNRLLAERDPGFLRDTEINGVCFDNLGHGALCLINMSPRWREYTLQIHRAEVEVIASMGSWQACEWLGGDRKRGLSDDERLLADRFFMGDVETANALRRAYGF